MEKKEQALVISPPNELKFRGPFTRPVQTMMRLTNPTDQPIWFKIKTTAPKKYCVRPNFGFIAPHLSSDVAIVLQAFVFDPSEKNKHKFMVQSLVAEEDTDVEKLWREQPDLLMDSKLRCVFELPVDSATKQTAVELGSENSKLSSNDVAATEQGVTKTGNDDKQNDSQQGDYARAAAEVRQLREEESHLRQENLQLKEELLKLRLTVEGIKNEQSTKSSSPFANPYSPPQLGQPAPVIYIGLAIAMALVGLLFGKYLL